MATTHLIRQLLCITAVAYTISMVWLPVSLPPPMIAAEAMPMLHGRIVHQQGNQLPGVRQPQSRTGASGVVVVVAGPFSPRRLGDPFLPAAALQIPILASGRSSADGGFAVRLPPPVTWPERVTLMLQVPGGYYLNRFDDQGRFASLGLPEALRELQLLIDDRSAHF